MMERSVKELSVPVAVIVAESSRRGRRRRLARRLRTAATVLTVVVLAGVGANAGLSTLAAQAPSGSTGPAGPGASSLAASPSPSATGAEDGAGPLPSPFYSPLLDLPKAPVLGEPGPSRSPSGAMTVKFTPKQVYFTVSGLLPKSMQYLETPQPYPLPLPSGTVGVAMQYVDGSGEPAAIEVTMRHSRLPFPKDGRAPEPTDLPFQCEETVRGDGTHSVVGCHYGFLPDGSWEMVESNDALVPGVFSNRVRLWRPDGTVMEFTEFSGLRDRAQEGGAQSTHLRTTPPVPLDIWRGVAESTTWHWFYA
ncbi:hypothetical protein ACFV1L_00955 [Kitasatospora sp. NPDC059646]|uniref:hypothetical protein n=1 Tax=Kitasatospora sp. NPDC059646 TaxID=3346893 RepID=UPI003692D81A